MFKERPPCTGSPVPWPARVQALAEAVQSDWNGDATAIWTQGEPSGAEVLKRLKALPGFGDQKAKIFLALLGKQRGLQAPGWREAAGHYGEDGSYLSVADIVDPESLVKVRASKQAAKAAAKAGKPGSDVRIGSAPSERCCERRRRGALDGGHHERRCTGGVSLKTSPTS